MGPSKGVMTDGASLLMTKGAFPSSVTLDNSSGMKITMDIWTRSARPWGCIDPESKQFPGQPDAPATTR